MKKSRILFFFILSLGLVIPVAGPPLASAAPGDLALAIALHNPPVVIQASGGSFDYTVTVTNQSDISQVFDIWTAATLPDGQTRDLQAGPYNFELPAGWDSSKILSQSVPATFPEGTSTFTAFAGLYPDVVWASQSFTFEKGAEETAGWQSQNPGTTSSLTSVYFADAVHGWAVGTRNTIVRTTDGGDNWYAQSVPYAVNFYDVFFTNVASGWAVGTGGKIAHTSDGGDSWALQDSGTRYSLYGVHFVNSTTGWIAGGRERTYTAPRSIILHTTDGGLTWKLQYSKYNQVPLKDVFFVDDANGWAVGEGGVILSTTNGGASWSEQNSGTLYGLNRVYFADINTGWAVGVQGNLLHTLNGGRSWFAQDPGVTAGLTDIQFVDPLRGWITTGDANGGAVLATNDGGNTWYPQDTGGAGFLYSLFFVDDVHGWAVGINGTLIRTSSGGD